MKDLELHSDMFIGVFSVTKNKIQLGLINTNSLKYKTEQINILLCLFFTYLLILLITVSKQIGRFSAVSMDFR